MGQQQGSAGLPRCGLFSERISAKIIEYAMTQPGEDGGAPDAYADTEFATPQQQMPPQGHFSQQGPWSSEGSQMPAPGHFSSPQTSDEWRRRSAEKRAIEEQLYAGDR